MTNDRIGMWLVGALGGVATTAAVGLAALKRQNAGTAGLVTELPSLARLPLVGWSNIVLGGCDIRHGTLLESARELARTNALPPALVEQHSDELAAIDKQFRPGFTFRSGAAIEQLVDTGAAIAAESPLAAIERTKADLTEFARDNGLDRVVVVIVSSTEPPIETSHLPDTWPDLARSLENRSTCPLRASSLYAIAAMELGMPVVNFTPSLGASCAAIEELAKLRGVCHAGRDGKTGETLLKTVLAPMFAARNLEVMSWVGHNIFGNMDGQVLDDPDNKAAKVRSKDHALSDILGYAPQSLVSIEYIKSLGDWKTAWDHIHFKGFLGVPMTMQFTWQGCDSILAAPLLLDLVRLVNYSANRGEVGALGHLASFFKSPSGDAHPGFAEQFAGLLAWADNAHNDN